MDEKRARAIARSVHRDQLEPGGELLLAHIERVVTSVPNEARSGGLDARTTNGIRARDGVLSSVTSSRSARFAARSPDQLVAAVRLWF
jgi:hypothetical protein